MKTKFTQLVLLRKKEVDEAEIMLQKNAQAIVAKQSEIDALVREFATLQEPKSGIYQNFLTFAYHKEEFRQIYLKIVSFLSGLVEIIAIFTPMSFSNAKI